MPPLSQFSECNRYWSLTITASRVSVITTAKPNFLRHLGALTCRKSFCRHEQLEQKTETEILVDREGG